MWPIRGGGAGIARSPWTDPPEDFREQWPIAAELDRGVFPAGFLNYPVHLHHDHDSGQSIGAVHAYCNAILWVHHGE